MNNLTTWQKIGMGVGGVVVLAGIGRVFYNKVQNGIVSDEGSVQNGIVSDKSLHKSLRLKNLAQMSGPIRQSFLGSIDNDDARALAATNLTIRRNIQSHASNIGKYQFMIGEYGKDYDGYHRMTDEEWKNDTMFDKFIQDYTHYSGIFVFKNSNFDFNQLLLDEYRDPYVDRNSVGIKCENGKCTIIYGKMPVGSAKATKIELNKDAVTKTRFGADLIFSHTVLNGIKQRGNPQEIIDIRNSYSQSPCIFIRDDIQGGKKTRRRRSQKKR